MALFAAPTVTISYQLAYQSLVNIILDKVYWFYCLEYVVDSGRDRCVSHIGSERHRRPWRQEPHGYIVTHPLFLVFENSLRSQ